MRKRLFYLFALLPLPLLHGLAWLAGQLLFVLQTRQAFIAQRNLQVCLPELGPDQRRHLARRSLIETSKTLLESFKLWLAPATRVTRLVREVKGEARLREALQRQQGVLLLVPHLGNWEMIGLYCSQHYPMTSLYRPQRSDFFDQLILEGRSRFGADLVSATTEGVRAVVRALKQNRIVGILPDQNPGAGAGTFVPFFGVLANTPLLPGRLAHKTGAPVICAWAERLSWGRGFVLHFTSLDEAIAQADAQQAALVMNRELERIIRYKPEQYWWSHNRFRHRPEGEPDIY